MESYDASKNRLQDLKNFPTFKTVTTYYNSTENSTKTIFTMLNRLKGIKHQLKALFDRLNMNQASIESGRSFRSIFLINLIDWSKALTNRTSWNLNFHKENFRSRNSILFILQMNTLQSYISITIYSCIYLYIQ